MERGITEKRFVEVNGARQGMIISGHDDQNPVLLFLHGGLPETFLAQRYPTGLEERFTIVWWEQRGAGLSFDPHVPPGSITTAQLIEDTITLTNHLRQRFGQERIYLMAHSGGTFIGIQAAARAPGLFAAYIGVAQIANQLRSEELAHAYLLAEFASRGDRRMVRRLRSAPVNAENGTPRGYLALRDAAMHRLGIGTTHAMRSVVTGLLLPSLAYRGYTLREKLNLWRAKARSGVSAVWADMLATDLAGAVPALPIPAYFLHGVFDYTSSYPIARDYASRLIAPTKGFYTFEHSAHSPHFEEPARVREILVTDVLGGRVTLADR